MTLQEQLNILIGHWIDHNEAHRGTYLKWAEKAREGGLEETAALIEEIASKTGAVTADLDKALKSVPQ